MASSTGRPWWRPALTGERRAALVLLAVLLLGGGLFVWDQLAYCGIRCTTGIRDAADLDRLAREQGITRLPVPTCEAAPTPVRAQAWPVPVPVTAVAAAQGRLFAAGADGLVLAADVPPAGQVPAWAPWAPAGAAVQAGGPVTALTASSAPDQLLVATSSPAQVLALDLATGTETARWPLAEGALVRAAGAGGGRAVLVDGTSGAVHDAVVTNQGAGTWGPLRQLRQPGELPGATTLLIGVTGGAPRPVAVVAEPSTLRSVDVRTGAIRVLVTGGAGVDRPLSQDAPALVRAAGAALVDGELVLVDEGRVRPARLDTAWTAVGVGAASPVEGLPEPVAVTGTDDLVVVADGTDRLLAVPAPVCDPP